MPSLGRGGLAGVFSLKKSTVVGGEGLYLKNYSRGRYADWGDCARQSVREQGRGGRNGGCVRGR